MSDLVQRLRRRSGWDISELEAEAAVALESQAAEIERLRKINGGLLGSLSDMVKMMDDGDEPGSGSDWHKDASAAIAAAKAKG